MITFAPKRLRISDASAMVSEASGPGAGWFSLGGFVVGWWTTLGGTGLITKMPLNFQGSKSETSTLMKMESWIEFFLFFYINRWIWKISDIYIYIYYVYIYIYICYVYIHMLFSMLICFAL